MEFRIDQLLVIVAVIAATLFDLLVRWQRRKRGGAPVPDAGDDDRWVIVDGEGEAADDGRHATTTRLPAPRGPDAYPAPRRAPFPPSDGPPTVRAPDARSVAIAAPVAPRARASATGPARVSARRQRHAPAWAELRTGATLRRAIVLAEILGPCRGLQRPGEDGSRAGPPA